MGQLVYKQTMTLFRRLDKDYAQVASDEIAIIETANPEFANTNEYHWRAYLEERTDGTAILYVEIYERGNRLEFLQLFMIMMLMIISFGVLIASW